MIVWRDYAILEQLVLIYLHLKEVTSVDLARKDSKATENTVFEKVKP